MFTNGGIEIADVSDMAFVNSPCIELHNREAASDTPVVVVVGWLASGDFKVL